MIAMATAVANRAMTNASPMNCAMRPLFPAPSTFLTPTSFARCSLRAVARFMKLMQAMKRMIHAMTENRCTYAIRPPPVCLPLSN